VPSFVPGLASLLVLAQLLRGSIAGDQELVRFERNAAGTALSLLTVVPTPPERLIGLLADPATYRRAVPAFVRADVLEEKLEEKPGRASDRARLARLLGWELEVPLWNLKGRLWLRPQPAGVDLELVEGDLAPGKIELRVEADGAGSALRMSGGANLKNANFMTRRLAARDREAEPAMTVTALYVLLRALALEAARTGAVLPRRRPTAPMAAGPLGDGARAFFAGLPAEPGTVHARITSRPSGRLERVEVAVPVPLPPATATARVLEPARWQALPGWKHIANLGGQPVRWDVDASLPFVDFDATWTLQSQRPFRAEASGDWKGAALAVDVFPRGPGAVMVFTAHPRVDATGYIPRKLIEAEPLLEQGLALGLAFVNAGALARALVTAPLPPRAPQLSPSGRQKIE
jgi:hypothetical protein